MPCHRPATTSTRLVVFTFCWLVISIIDVFLVVKMKIRGPKQTKRLNQLVSSNLRLRRVYASLSRVFKVCERKFLSRNLIFHFAQRSYRFWHKLSFLQLQRKRKHFKCNQRIYGNLLHCLSRLLQITARLELSYRDLDGWH